VILLEHRAPDGESANMALASLALPVGRFHDEANVVFAGRSAGMDVADGLSLDLQRLSELPQRPPPLALAFVTRPKLFYDLRPRDAPAPAP
jgi:hypothetical protein